MVSALTRLPLPPIVLSTAIVTIQTHPAYLPKIFATSRMTAPTATKRTAAGKIAIKRNSTFLARISLLQFDHGLLKFSSDIFRESLTGFDEQISDA